MSKWKDVKKNMWFFEIPIPDWESKDATTVPIHIEMDEGVMPNLQDLKDAVQSCHDFEKNMPMYLRDWANALVTLEDMSEKDLQIDDGLYSKSFKVKVRVNESLEKMHPFSCHRVYAMNKV